MTKNSPKPQPKAIKEDDDRDLLRFEFETLLEEYRITASQIMNRRDEEDKGLDFWLTAVGVAVGAAAFVVNQKMYALLLVLAIPFHVFIWSQVRRVETGRKLVEYTTKVLAPRLDAIIQHTSPSASRYGKPIHFVSWEGFMADRVKRDIPTYFTIALLQTGRAFIHLSATVVLPTAYFMFQQNDTQYTVSPFDMPLLIVNGILMILSIVLLLVIFFRTRKHLPS